MPSASAVIRDDLACSAAPPSSIWPMRFGEHVDEIAVGARQQPGRHLDDVTCAAERGVDAAQLEADVAAADDEQRLRDVAADRARRVESMTRGLSSARATARHSPGREPVARIACSNCTVLFAAVVQRHAQVVRVDDLGEALEVLHLAMLDELPGAAGQPARRPWFLNSRSLSRSIVGSPNSTPHAAAWRDSSITLATCSSAFDGMQPR